MKVFFVLLILAGLLPMSTWAQEEGAAMDDMVVTATMNEKALEEVPGSIEIVTAAEIEELGAVTVAEALEWSVGLVVTGESGRTQVPSIRGTGSKQSLMLIDGRRWANGYKDFIDINQLPVTMIERIEIVRGPGSALYGSDAIGGVVNIITRATPEEFTASVDARYGLNTYSEGDAYRASATVGSRAGKFGFLLSAALRDLEAWDITGELPDDRDDIGMTSMAGRLTYDLSPGHQLTAGFEYITHDRDGMRFIQNQERLREAADQRLNYHFNYNGQLGSGGRLVLGAYHSEHDNGIVLTPTGPETAEEDAEHSLDQVEARYSTALFDGHFVTFGGEFRQEAREDVSGSDEDLSNGSLFVQDEIQLTEPLYLALGARIDDHSEFGSHFTPRASVVYRLLENLRFKASYGEGFRAPSISELFVESLRRQGRDVYEPNDQLDPEKSRSYELGVEAEFGPASASVTLFRNDVDDLIVPVLYRTVPGPNPPQSTTRYYIYRNVDEARMEGVETEVSMALAGGFRLAGQLSWLDTENKETGAELTGQPDLKGGIKLAYKNSGLGLSANIRADYRGEMLRTVSETSATVSQVPGVTLWHLYLSQSVSDIISLYAGINNLFDKRQVDEGTLLTDPAFYYAGVRLTF